MNVILQNLHSWQLSSPKVVLSDSQFDSFAEQIQIELC